MTMENLFKQVGFSYKEMEPFEFYDISDKKIYTSSYNEKDDKIEKKLIIGIVYKGDSLIYEIRTRSGDVLLKGSPNHLIYDVSKKDYVSLKDVQTACVLNRQKEKIDVVIINTGKVLPIVDISVEGNENYFSNGILSHNTGGFALKYAAATSFRTRKIENLTEGSKIIGIHIHCKNYKNKTAVPFRECEMDLYFKDGFDSTCEYVDFLKEFNEDSRLVPLCYAGNGGVFKSEKYGWSFRGKDNFIEAVKNGQVEGWEEIKKAIIEIISNEIEGMENTADPEQEFEQNLTEEKADELDQQEIEQ